MLTNNQIELRKKYDSARENKNNEIHEIHAQVADQIALAEERFKVTVGTLVHEAVNSGMRKVAASEAIRAYSNWSRWNSFYDAVETIAPTETVDAEDDTWTSDGMTYTFFGGWKGFDPKHVPDSLMANFTWPEDGFDIKFSYGENGDVEWSATEGATPSIGAFMIGALNALGAVAEKLEAK